MIKSTLKKTTRLNFVSVCAIFCFFNATFLSIPSFSQVYLDSTASVNDRVEDLLSRMTLEEKIGQMVQTERNFTDVNSAITTYFLGSILSGGGSTPGSNTVQDWISMYNGMQDAALATRLKIPIIYGVDAVHGHNNVYGATIFPHNIGMGCSRDSLLVYRCARATASEVLATGLNWTFSPCNAVPRNIRWGRTYEGFGETPALEEIMSAAAVYGYQGDTLGTPGRILACAKHYAGDGGTTNGTDQGNTVIDEAGLRQFHLPGYVKAVGAGVGSVMVSFSSWNGVKCHINKYLVTDLLKGELGFKGFVVSDWDGVHNVGGDYKTTIGIAVNAGIDMFMEPYSPVEFIDNLVSLVYSGTVPQSRIDDAAGRILKVKFRMHLFEHPYALANMADSLGSASHRALAREAVRKSLVLLKNSGNMLPLSKTNGRILVAGPKASDIGSQCGGWTITWQGSTGQITTGTTIYNAVKSARGSENVVYSSNGSTGEAVDLAIVVVGETPYAEGTGDSPKPQLTMADLTVIANVKQLNIPYVILLISGRPLILDEVTDDADALVACWLPGTEASGTTDVLFGDFDFTGKLSQTWPSAISQEPINWGDSQYQPLFPYGYGLSYAQNDVPSIDTIAFSFYPNPAEDILMIRSDCPGNVEIYDSAGELILKSEIDKQDNCIPISELSRGVYVIIFTDKTGVYRRKFVKV
jgi:beta-glucosidase